MAHAVEDCQAAGASARDGMPKKDEPRRVGAWSRRRSPTLARIGHSIPTLAVVVLLASLGVYGHRSGWKLPTFAALAGHAATADGDWCEGHAVPESLCVECNPDLLPRGEDHGWCREHGVHDCPLEHPDVVQLKEPPTDIEADRRRAARALAVRPRSTNNALCQNYRRRIQFSSDDAVKKAGVDVAVVARQKMTDTISAPGEITYDQTHYARLSSRLPGTVWYVAKNVGDWVRAGDVLALVNAAEVGQAKTELMQALVQAELQQQMVNRLDGLASQGIVPGRQWQAAQAELAQAEAQLLSAQQTLLNLGLPVDLELLRSLSRGQRLEQLRFLGIPTHHTEHLAASETTANLLPVTTPLDGVIVSRDVVAGEAVDASRELFAVADTSRMWLTLSVTLEDAERLAPGQMADFHPDGTEESVRGTLDWISTTADPQTRAVRVRAELPNPAGHLRHGTFGAGRIILREEPQAIVIPNEAVHWDGDCHVVFVRDRNYFASRASLKVFHVRTVRPGARDERFTEIIVGVMPGEVVAAKGSDVLRAEMLKNNLGEGCCAEE